MLQIVHICFFEQFRGESRPDPVPLNVGGRTRSGAFDTVWPSAIWIVIVFHNACWVHVANRAYMLWRTMSRRKPGQPHAICFAMFHMGWPIFRETISVQMFAPNFILHNSHSCASSPPNRFLQKSWREASFNTRRDGSSLWHRT